MQNYYPNFIHEKVKHKEVTQLIQNYTASIGCKIGSLWLTFIRKVGEITQYPSLSHCGPGIEFTPTLETVLLTVMLTWLLLVFHISCNSALSDMALMPLAASLVGSQGHSAVIRLVTP